jgi:putative thiamine transport system substrate-binding protein
MNPPKRTASPDTRDLAPHTPGGADDARRRWLLGAAALTGSTWLAPAVRASGSDWPSIVSRARGQTVYFNAWAGDEKTNEFIAWLGGEMRQRHGITVQHVRLKDTAEAVTRIVAEKAAGRDRDGSVDLVWINGPNFLALKQQGLLRGPLDRLLPNHRLVDTVNKRSNVIDFTTPVEGMAVPWRLAQIVFVAEGTRVRELPRSAPALLDWARRNPGRLTHPNVTNFLGSTFLKQVLVDLLADAAVLQQPADDASFVRVTEPLWAWTDAARPHLWRQGRQYPENGSAQRQLLNDGEIDIMLSFNPAEAAVSIAAGLLPPTVRTFTFAKGTIGNTSFVAIPYNARAADAALVVANALLEPATQARVQDIRGIGALNVLDLNRLAPAERAHFDRLTPSPALPIAAELGVPQLEPHASWMTRITAEWQRRYSR